jgi:hypothetical protein
MKKLLISVSLIFAVAVGVFACATCGNTQHVKPAPVPLPTVSKVCPHCNLKFDSSKTDHFHYSQTQISNKFLCGGCRFCDLEFVKYHNRLPAGRCWLVFPCTQDKCALNDVKARLSQ